MAADTATTTTGSDADVASAGLRPIDDGIETAVSLGWQVAEFFREVGIPRADPIGIPENLPGITKFPAVQLWKLRLDQIDVAFARLGPILRRELAGTTGVSLPPIGPLRALSPTDERARPAVLQLHRDILDILTAANFRLGKAYGLGVGLADLSLEPEPTEDFFRESFSDGGRVDGIIEAFDGLKSLLPPHAAESVAGSLREWQAWVMNHLDLPRSKHPDWARVANTLKTQGKRWRAILTGEKHATDFLGIDDFILAGEGLLARFRMLTSRFIAQHWIAVLMVLVLTAAVVALALTFAEGTAKFWTIAVWLAGSVGVSGATIKNGVSRVIGRIGDGLWGAELDLAIIKAITTLPYNDPASIAPPPPPMARSNRAYHKSPTGPATRPLDETTMKEWGPQRTGQPPRPL